MFEDINNLADKEQSDAAAKTEAEQYLADQRLLPLKEVAVQLDRRCSDAVTSMWQFCDRVNVGDILARLTSSVTRLQAYAGALLDVTPFFWRPVPQSMHSYTDIKAKPFQQTETCAVVGYLLNWRDCDLNPTALMLFKNWGEHREDPVSVVVVSQTQSLTPTLSLKPASLDAMFSEGVETVRRLTLREVLNFAKQGYATTKWRDCFGHSPGVYQSAALYYMQCVYKGERTLSPLREAHALHLLRNSQGRPLAQMLDVPEWPTDQLSLARSHQAVARKKPKVPVANRFSDSHDTDFITKHQYEELNKLLSSTASKVDELPQNPHPPFCYRSSRFTPVIQAAFELPAPATTASKAVKGGTIGRQSVALDTESAQGLVDAQQIIVGLLETAYMKQLVR